MDENKHPMTADQDFIMERKAIEDLLDLYREDEAYRAPKVAAAMRACGRVEGLTNQFGRNAYDVCIRKLAKTVESLAEVRAATLRAKSILQVMKYGDANDATSTEIVRLLGESEDGAPKVICKCGNDPCRASEHAGWQPD